MPSYAVRVSLSYDDISGVIKVWSESCAKMVVYEHERDNEVSRTHIHALMVMSKYKTPEALKRQFHSRVETADNGNALWSWKTTDDDSTVWSKYVTYMSKGSLRPVFANMFLPTEVEELRLQWKEPTPKGESSEKKESTKSRHDLLQEMLSEIDESEIVDKCMYSVSSYLVSVVLKVLRKNRIVIGRYKVREYRDSLMIYSPNIIHKFINFVNEDIKDDY